MVVYAFNGGLEDSRGGLVLVRGSSGMVAVSIGVSAGPVLTSLRVVRPGERC